MHRHLFINILLLFNMVFCSIFVQKTDAYILQGPHILDLMVKKYGKLDTLFVSQKIFFHDDALENTTDEFHQNLKYDFPETFRSEIIGENREWIHVRSKDESVTVIDGKIFDFNETVFDRYTTPLLYQKRHLLQHKLLSFGVDVSISSLGRFRDQVVYIIGAAYPDESKSQIWFEKSTLKPLRWIMVQHTDEGDAETIDVIFDNWKEVGKTWYPMLVEFIKNGNKVREIKVVEVEANPVFSKEQFDIQRIRSTYPSMSDDVSTPDESNPLFEVQKSIDDFKRIYE